MISAYILGLQVMYENGNVNATHVFSSKFIIMIKTKHKVRKFLSAIS
jgi:hypothetical protein